VNLLLAGEISQAEGKLVVTLAVRDAAVNRTLRSASLRLDRQDLASGETAISNRAAALLGVNLVSSRDRRPASISPGAPQYREQALSYSARRDDASLVIATDFLRRSIAADALYSDAYADLARVLILRYSNARDAALLVEAEEVCDQARRIGGESPGLLLADSRIAGFRGDSPDAMRLLQRSLDLDPHNADALSALARLFDEAGRTLNAEQTYQRAIEAHSGDWKVYTSLGHFYQTHGLNADAEKNFRIAYDLAPDSPRAISNLGALLLYMHRNEDAVVLLRHGLEVRPTAAGYSNLGTVLFFSGQYLQAAEAYRKAVALAPSDDRYRRNLGDAYLRLNDLPAAKTAWSDAVDLVSQQMRREPGNPVLGASRALYLAKCGRAAEARAQVASSLNSHAADPALLFRCAVALELCANRLGAIRLLKDAFAHGLALSEVQTAAELDELREDPGFIHIAPPETPNK
jgi:serine/threonine-protein kinase